MAVIEIFHHAAGNHILIGLQRICINISEFRGHLVTYMNELAKAGIIIRVSRHMPECVRILTAVPGVD